MWGIYCIIWKLTPYTFSTHYFWFYHLGPQRTNFTFLHHSSLKTRRQLSFVYFFKKPNIYWIFYLDPDLPWSPSTLKNGHCAYYSHSIVQKIEKSVILVDSSTMHCYLLSPHLYLTLSYPSLRKIASTSTCFHRTLFEVVCLLRFRLTSGCLHP